MNELKQLRALSAKLRQNGKCVLSSSANGPAGMSVHRLTYETAGDVPSYWPITGAAQFELTFDESAGQWTTTGSMFGVAPQALDPHAFFSQIAQGAATREQTLRGFLQQAGQVSERYTGDLNQMMYRLGVQMAAVGIMVELEHFWCWSPSIDPGVVVYFSRDTAPPDWLETPKIFIGFNQDISLHHWELTQPNLMAIREQLKVFAAQAQSFCADLNSCFR